jgi:subfamily B ATP-binding cassette protein MsbA
VILQQGLESIRAVNAFGREDFEDAKLQKVSQETLFAALKSRKVKSVVSPFVAVTVSLCTAFVLWRGADLILKGAMSVGALTVFLWYMNKFFSPVQNLAKMTSSIAQVTVALERIQAILNTDTIIAEKPGAINPDKFIGKIVFDQVSFAYNSGTPVITNFNLTINPGERIGICGPTGSGKSTIVSLISRFYDPSGGRILIDDTDITDFTLDGLRSQIGFVLQDTVLFYGSIRENIA